MRAGAGGTQAQRTRVAVGTGELLRAEHLHQGGAIDCQSDQAMDVRRRCTAVDLIDITEELLNPYPVPTHLRIDHGLEFMAHALEQWSAGNGSGTAYALPGSPRANPFLQPSMGPLSDGSLNIALFASLLEAKVQVEQYGIEKVVDWLNSSPRGVASWQFSNNGKWTDLQARSYTLDL